MPDNFPFFTPPTMPAKNRGLESECIVILEQLILKWNLSLQETGCNRIYTPRINYTLPRSIGRTITLVGSNDVHRNIDIAICIVHNGVEVPIIVGEVCSHKYNKEISRRQVVYYQLAYCRPYWAQGSETRLLGFVIDTSTCDVQEITSKGWLSRDIFKLIRLVSYSRRNDDSTFYYKFFWSLLNEAEAGLKAMSRNDYEQLFEMSSSTIHFGLSELRICGSNGAPLQSGIAYLPSCSFLRDYFDKFDIKPNFLRLLDTSMKDFPLVIKVSSKYWGGGHCDRKKFANLLNSITFRSSNLNCDAFNSLQFRNLMHKLYFAVFSHDPRYVITATRFFGSITCGDQYFRNCWKTSNLLLRNHFYKEVFEVALEAVGNGVYHWDIRSPNIVFNLVEAPFFYLIDWESSCLFNEDKTWLEYICKNAPHTSKFLSKYIEFPDIIIAFAICENIIHCLLRYSIYEFTHVLRKRYG